MTRGRIAVAALVFACFAVFALWRSPVPGVNEPQYLCKAKHFYAPDWCANDMFLNSSNAHWVFYALAGAVTRFASLDETAWIGRILLWAGLAYAWVRLVHLLLPGRFAPLWAACLFVALQALGNLSGEWLIGGVEAKGFAYLAILLAIVAVCEDALWRAGVAVGIAISLHPVVGMWGALGLSAALIGRGLTARRARLSSTEMRPAVGRQLKPGEPSAPTDSFSWRSLAIPCVLALVLSLPGLIPAMAVVASAPSKTVAQRADKIQVFERLAHHLDPAQFSRTGYRMYAGLLAAWLVMTVFGGRSVSQRFFNRFVLSTLVMALAGFVAGFWLRKPELMKFYPFRLFDVFLPMAVSMTVVGLVARGGQSLMRGSKPPQRMVARLLAPGVGLAALVVAFAAPGRDPNPGKMYSQNWMAFVDACGWIERSTPRDALFLTPRSKSVGFKWYAQRAEYVTWKDCPQDAAGIVEWKQRLTRIDDWREAYSENGYSQAEFADLARQTGVDYVLTWNTEPWHIEPVFRNRAFSIYRLAK